MGGDELYNKSRRRTVTVAPLFVAGSRTRSGDLDSCTTGNEGHELDEVMHHSLHLLSSCVSSSCTAPTN